MATVKEGKGKQKKSPRNSAIEFVIIIAVALGLAIGIQAFIVKPFRIPSPSMVPTLKVGQRVLVNRLGPHFGDPSRGNIVVFKPPKGADPGLDRCGIPSEPADGRPCERGTPQQSDSNFIKRVVAVPGDWLYVKENRVYLGKSRGGPFVLQKEPFIAKGSSPCDGSELCNLQTPIQVPPDHFFMMGDNRAQSDDSPKPHRHALSAAAERAGGSSPMTARSSAAT